MESELAQQARRELIEAMQRLTPEQRLNAFLTHCQLVMALRAAAQQLHAREQRLSP